jgi:hypothetical protein
VISTGVHDPLFAKSLVPREEVTTKDMKSTKMEIGDLCDFFVLFVSFVVVAPRWKLLLALTLGARPPHQQPWR